MKINETAFKMNECNTMGSISTTVITLNIGTPRPATVVVLNIKQFNFTLR